ncbi:MAG: hypothetical protein WCK35_30105 [Chloroflexota bacterium]
MKNRDFRPQFHPDTPRIPLSEAEFETAVETKLGKCKCGGQFTKKASVRCPKCKSIELVIIETGPMFD